MPRMKKSWWWSWVMIGGLLWSGEALAKEQAKTQAKTKESSSAPEKAPKKASPASVDAKQEAEKKALEALNGTHWAIELSPLSGEPPKHPPKDTVGFDKGKVMSEKLSAAGFPATNCTVTVGSDGVAVWETMQTGQDSSVAFWRGELHGESMRGILSKHSAKGAVEDWAFSGKLVATSSGSEQAAKASTASKTASVEEAPAAPAADLKPAATTKKSNKKN